MNKYAIYIFTCNRPIKLEGLLVELVLFKNAKYDIYIIDDSSNFETIEKNKEIANRYDIPKYLGVSQYCEFYQKKFETNDRRLIGDLSWNLGIARNFALDHSNFVGYEKVLFIDDDISDIDEEKIETGFSILTNDCFVSCNLNGLEDNSIVGHIAKKVGVIDDGDKMLSGGFLFLSPGSLSSRFYNIYNEDWILQLLDRQKEKIMLPYSVNHNVDHAVNWTFDQAIFQELGELIVEGLLIDRSALSMDFLFWKDILNSRIKYIEEIKEYSIKTEYQHGKEICDEILNWLRPLDGPTLQKLIEQIIN